MYLNVVSQTSFSYSGSITVRICFFFIMNGCTLFFFSPIGNVCAFRAHDMIIFSDYRVSPL